MKRFKKIVKPNVDNFYMYGYFLSLSQKASVAQLVEQRFCKPSVIGSNPVTGSFCEIGEIPKRPTGADCKSVVLRLRRFESCSPHKLSERNSIGRVSAFQAECCRFDPGRSLNQADIAQR